MSPEPVCVDEEAERSAELKSSVAVLAVALHDSDALWRACSTLPQPSDSTPRASAAKPAVRVGLKAKFEMASLVSKALLPSAKPLVMAPSASRYDVRAIPPW